MTRTVIYARMSQDREGLAAGIDRQVEDCRKFAESKALQIDHDPYIDNDVSATSLKPRPAWTQLIKDVQAGEVSTIIVWHLDRLYRTMKDLLVLLDLAKKHQLRILAVRDGELDLSTESGRLMASVMASVANFEVDRKTARSIRANEKAASEGRYNGGPTHIGYRSHAQDPSVPKGTLKIDEREARVLREAADRILEGHSLNSTTEWVRGQLPEKVRFKTVSLKAALTSYTVAGLRYRVPVSVRREWAEKVRLGQASGKPPESLATITQGNWEPILDSKTWHAVRTRLLRDSVDPSKPKGRGRPNKPENLLSGLLVCEICGHRLGYSKQAYKCGSTVRQGCSGLAISTPAVEKAVSEIIEGALQRVAPEETVEPEPFPEEVESEFARQRLVLLDIFKKGLIEAEELEAQLRELSDQLQRARAEHEARQEDRVALRRSKTIDLAYWQSASVPERREVIRMFYPAITIFKSPGGRASGARFNPSRIYMGPPPWLNERLPEEIREAHRVAHEQRLQGIAPEPVPGFIAVVN